MTLIKLHRFQGKRYQLSERCNEQNQNINVKKESIDES